MNTYSYLFKPFKNKKEKLKVTAFLLAFSLSLAFPNQFL